LSAAVDRDGSSRDEEPPCASHRAAGLRHRRNRDLAEGIALGTDADVAVPELVPLLQLARVAGLAREDRGERARRDVAGLVEVATAALDALLEGAVLLDVRIDAVLVEHPLVPAVDAAGALALVRASASLRPDEELRDVVPAAFDLTAHADDADVGVG